jgi:hypothetical protein
MIWAHRDGTITDNGPDDNASRAVLVGSHLLAAAIVIPALSHRLTAVAAVAENGRCSRLDEVCNH